jgi:hypothetical protein
MEHMETVKRLRLGHAGLLFQLKSWVPPQLPFISPAQSIQVLSFMLTAQRYGALVIISCTWVRSEFDLAQEISARPAPIDARRAGRGLRYVRVKVDKSAE